MLLNRSIKTLPPPRRHNAVTIRLTDMIEWLGQRPPSKALDKTIALLTEARREILRAWPEFADLSPPDPEVLRPVGARFLRALAELALEWEREPGDAPAGSLGVVVLGPTFWAGLASAGAVVQPVCGSVARDFYSFPPLPVGAGGPTGVFGPARGGHVVLNARFVREALLGDPGPTVLLGLEASRSPVYIVRSDGENHVIMPMAERLR